MVDLGKSNKFVQSLFKKAQSQATIIPAYIQFEDNHVEHQGESTVTPFVGGEHYFDFIMDEMYLSASRKWFSEYSPVVFAATEFIYDKSFQTVPKVIGPRLLETYEKNLPQSTRFIGVPVSGLHPYNGGNFSFVIILYRAERTNHLHNFLNLLENVVSTFNLSVALGSYLNLVDVIMDGLDVILDKHNAEPLVAVHETINVAINGALKPAFYALINAPESSINVNKLWVRDGRLYTGDTLESATKPYMENDFALFRIAQAVNRNDERSLPFFPVWEETQKLATKTATWEEAKVKFTILWEHLLTSPDLTAPQKKSLKASYKEQLQQLRREALDHETMGSSTQRDLDASSMETEINQLNSFLNELN